MPAKTQKVLSDFDWAAGDLRALLRTRPPLTEAEQLFIENRLMMLQIEYTLWTNMHSKTHHGPARGKKSSSLDIE